ncbi:MAG: NusG domain II-containing protein [Clostridia bacterium]|nr:NusG domain II-containing protein [Clostridia bacterium]
MKKKDYIFAVVLLLIFGILFVLTQNHEEGTYVTVSIDGKQFGSYVLTAKEQTVNIGENNILTIINNEAFMSYAACPDQICVKKGAVSKEGEDIVCMPNCVIVKVKGGENDAE